jgi:hypothetical protein
MEVNLLCVGDVVGGPGRRVLREGLASLIPEKKLDCVIVNAENASAGSGLTPQLFDKIIRSGANLITLGDHAYRRRDIIPTLEQADGIVRPANLPASAPGKQFATFTTRSGHRVAVVSLLGRLFVKSSANCPYAAIDRVLATIPKDVKIIVVDMHAEATSEKIAMGWHLDGRVSVLFGTHTHIPTADERILPKGTAYITDVGMTGPYDSVLGRDTESVLRTLINGVPERLDVAEHDARLCGLAATVDPTTGKALRLERVRFDGSDEE